MFKCVTRAWCGVLFTPPSLTRASSFPQCLSAAVCHLGCSASSFTLGRREARPLAELSPPRVTASPWGPKSSGPEADPQQTLPKCTRAKIEPIKNDHYRGPSKTIKNDHPTSDPTGGPSKTIKQVLCPTLAQSQVIASHQTAPPRPTTRRTAGQNVLSVLQLRAWQG